MMWLREIAIVNYMTWAIEQPTFKGEVEKIVQDYIDFRQLLWYCRMVDQRAQQKR